MSAVGAGVVGGALVPHAPQFFSLPDTEDKPTVERVRTTLGEVGRRLADLEPDIWIVVANDHASQFLLHCTPQFAFHLGAEVKGSFVGRDFRYKVEGNLALQLLRYMQEEGFDPAFTNNADIDYAFGIPLTFLGVQAPILPLYINSYVPPQPSMQRAYAFGQALARGIKAMGKRAVIIASGGMSHFPGTERYSNPEVEFDRMVFDKVASGNLRYLLGLDERLLDDTGNVELRSWALAGGMLGERKADISSFDPSWHHTYATIGWMSPAVERQDPLHYPGIAPERVRLTELLYWLANKPDERARYLADPVAYCAQAGITPPEQEALAEMNQSKLLKLGIHPLVSFLAHLQVERERKPH